MAAMAKFGAITAQGLAVQAPSQMAGALWEGRYTDGDGASFRLYLSRLTHGGWLGMLFLQSERRWVRLHDIGWQPAPTAQGQSGVAGALTFRHPTAPDEAVFARYQADVYIPDQGQTRTDLQGIVTVNGVERRWVAGRVAGVGVWQRSGGWPVLSHLALNALEGDYDTWHARYISGKPQWAPGGLVTWTGNEVRIAMQEITGIASIAGTLEGDILRAMITRFGDDQWYSGWARDCRKTFP